MFLQSSSVTEEVVQHRSEAQHSSDWYDAFSLLIHNTSVHCLKLTALKFLTRFFLC